MLLVSSRSEPDKWTVVGGGVEPNESGMTTSAREAHEEVRREGGGREGRRERERGREGEGCKRNSRIEYGRVEG